MGFIWLECGIWGEIFFLGKESSPVAIFAAVVFFSPPLEPFGLLLAMRATEERHEENSSCLSSAKAANSVTKQQYNAIILSF
jgi:hypothetical protein